MRYEAPSSFRDELIEGELILSPSANRRHADLCHRLLFVLEEVVSFPDFVVRLDTTMLLDEEEEKGNRPRPDVFVIDAKRWQESDVHGGYPLGSPQLAIEVLSPSTEQMDREIKTPKYLESGSLLVWLVDGERREVTVIRNDGFQSVLGIDDVLSLPSQLTQLCKRTLPVARIFADIR